MKNHVIICGLGNIGFHVFELLCRARIPVAVISDKTHAEWVWQVERFGGRFFKGDARDDNLLLDAGIKDAKAILALTNQDKINLSIAVDAQKLNPNIKIISRIFDTDLGNLVADAFDIQQVFSTTELSAPLFSYSIHSEKILGRFTFQNKKYLVRAEEKKIKQKKNTIVLGCDAQKCLIAKPLKIIKKKRSRFYKFISHYYRFRTPVFIFFRRFLTILLLVILFSTLFLAWAMPLSLVNALYFVVATVSSVGYGDINFLRSSDALKYFGCLLMLTGTAIFAVLFSSITEMILARKLPNLTGGFPVPKKRHVIIVGADHLGTRIVCNLMDAVIPIVVIENENLARFPEDIARQLAIVNGNPKSDNTLLRANIKSATALIAITKDDIENLSISLAAKKLNPKLTEITQIDNMQIRGSLQKALSLTNLLSVPFIASPYFVAATIRPHIIFAIEWHQQIIFIWNNQGEMKIESIPLYQACDLEK